VPDRSPSSHTAAPGSGVSALTARRLRAQLLSGPPGRDPVTVARHLLAIQAQDPRGARLAIRARTRGVTAADVDLELTERRSLVVTWLNRGTLHLVASEDYPWLQALTTPQLRTSSATRLAATGVDARQTARSLAVIERSLSDDGPLTRAQLRDRLDRADLRTDDGALSRLLFRAAIEGLIVRGPMIGGQHGYALVRDWLPRPPAFTRERALAELARRYLVGHGPATDRDLARWAGVPLGDARAGLAAIASQLAPPVDALVELAGTRRRPLPVPPRLLGAFEPLLLGWRSRAGVLAEHEARVISGGVFRGFALVAGRGAAGWRIADRRVVIEPFVALANNDADALARDGEAVLAFLGLR
jgi:DNA glycosylase AlkZ-like